MEAVVERNVRPSVGIHHGFIELYVNGEFMGSTETDGYIPGECGQGMEMGWDQGNSPAEICDHFRGVIDEVKVYGKALSQTEIAEQYRGDS